MTIAYHESLSWALQDILKVEHTSHVMLASSDGLLRDSVGDMGRDDADRLAAAMSGMKVLSESVTRECKRNWTSTVLEAEEGYHIVVSAADGSYLVAVTGYKVDLGDIIYQLTSLATQMNSHLSTPPRQDI